MSMQVVVLLSGGLDSATAATWAVREGFETRALAVRYGQRHARELDAARAVASRLGIPLAEVDATAFGQLARFSALTDPGRSLPLDRPAATMATEIPISYVPLRNTFFLTLAAAALESWCLERIEEDQVAPASLSPGLCIGANAIDYSGYPDCRPEFYAALTETLQLGSKLGMAYGLAPTILTPLIAMGKAEIVRFAIQLGAPLDLTWSCYAGGSQPCGHCDSCILRAAGFAEAGVPDPALAGARL